MMWMVDEVTQLVKEMLLEGNIHNIVVFTVITSSSVLSVVGALRHIYTFINNIRHVQHVEVLPQRTPDSDEADEVKACCLNDVSLVQHFDKLGLLSCQTKAQKQNMVNSTRNKGLKCLKCNGGLWERHCVQGLCDQCCDINGACQGKGHQRRPPAYLPWTKCAGVSDRIINLSRLALEELPPRLGFHCMNACTLDASHNALSQLPEDLAIMRDLINISLQDNYITSIPPFFACLHQLSFLDLRRNRLHTFPEALLDLPQLLRLYLDHNDLHNLPQDIDRLCSLHCLSVGYNHLSEICDSLFNIPGLQTLCFHGNKQLSTFPAGVGRLICLQKLDLGHCDLRIIPRTISSCMALRVFLVSSNRLLRLPCEISQCYRLERLDVSNNRLSYLPATLLFRQHTLLLNVSGNPLMRRCDLPRQWSVLDPVFFTSTTPFPSLWALAREAINRGNLKVNLLPLPVQDQLASVSSCFFCGQSVSNSLGAVRFSPWHQRASQHAPADLPFLFTFCTAHLKGCSYQQLEANLGLLCQGPQLA
ncbi:leucine-rich repeat-containing protein 1-like [Physella acuta]|uniref:leucine-rich repeat-containing protein 1-like n=1 Tax=Physella acuta TaxID=109671 RepID=UPI0027DB8B9D|nr:leucine-rich repeat-containing protein 1-like [Physella acuta]XP_059173114.1 leucine-rich repeat-containing protein 1-like [Physella acuta]XP_059173115.1 leucine-rich repeat-containing protein 1-like [Physella acuta]XP_059173116.1 leucine-rich repeat-containing protein 1-like [Physella acuta]